MKRPLLIGIREASLMLGVSDETARRLIKRGALTPVRIGFRVLIPLAQVEQIARHGWRYVPLYETRDGAAQEAR